MSSLFIIFLFILCFGTGEISIIFRNARQKCLFGHRSRYLGNVGARESTFIMAVRKSKVVERICSVAETDDLFSRTCCIFVLVAETARHFFEFILIVRFANFQIFWNDFFTPTQNLSRYYYWGLYKYSYNLYY